MLLRASSQLQGEEANLDSIVAPEQDSGVNGGAALLAFADAVLDGDAEAITDCRETVSAELGDAAMVDSAAIIANFQRMVRIADSTGIPLDEPVLMMTQDIRDDLGLNEFSAANNSPALSFGKRLAGKVLGPFAPRLMARLARQRLGAE